jgi:hypothetical protein
LKASRFGNRGAIFLIIEPDQIGAVLRTVAPEMHPLGGKINARVSPDRIGGRKIFLRPPDGAPQSDFEKAFDPESRVEMFCKLVFEQKDAFEQDDVDVLVKIFVFSKFRGGFFRKISYEANRTIFSQGQDQALEHLFEPQRILIKILRRILRIETYMRQIEPTVCVDDGDLKTFPSNLLRELRGYETFAARVDAGNAGEQSALFRHFSAFG